MTDAELTAFAKPFSGCRLRAFQLPHVALGEALPVVRQRVDPLYRSSRAMLNAFPALSYYAGIRVIEVTK